MGAVSQSHSTPIEHAASSVSPISDSRPKCTSRSDHPVAPAVEGIAVYQNPDRKLTDEFGVEYIGVKYRDAVERVESVSETHSTPFECDQGEDGVLCGDCFQSMCCAQPQVWCRIYEPGKVRILVLQDIAIMLMNEF